MDLHRDTATDEELINYCSRENTSRHVISELEGGKSIVKISDAVVKCGFGMTEDEARNQQRAYELVDSTVLRIPRVYRFFVSEEVGYLVMEYIDGKTLDTVPDPTSYVDRLAAILSYFAQIRSDTAGPLGGGTARGLLWLHADWIEPKSIEDVQGYYNKRQLKSHHLDIKNYPLVLCHLDVAPRNIMVQNDGSLWLIDWESAGFYPRLFEICTTRLNCRSPGNLNSKLLDGLAPLSDHEQHQADLLHHAYYLGEKHIMYVPLRGL